MKVLYEEEDLCKLYINDNKDLCFKINFKILGNHHSLDYVIVKSKNSSNYTMTTDDPKYTFKVSSGRAYTLENIERQFITSLRSLCGSLYSDAIYRFFWQYNVPDDYFVDFNLLSKEKALAFNNRRLITASSLINHNLYFLQPVLCSASRRTDAVSEEEFVLPISDLTFEEKLQITTFKGNNIIQKKIDEEESIWEI